MFSFKIPDGQSSRKQKFVFVASASTGLLAILSITLYLINGNKTASGLKNESSVSNEKITPISVIESTTKNITKKFKTYGILNPWKEVQIRPTANTRIQKVLFKVGDRVRANDIIIQSGSEVQELKAELDRIDNEIKEIDYGITMALAKRNFLSARDVKQKKLEFQANQLKTKIADLELTNRLKTPIDGIVAELPFNLGDYVDSNSQQVVKIVDTMKMKIPLYVPQSVAQALTLNSTVTVARDAEQNESTNPPQETSQIIGRISIISPSIDPKTGSVYVEVSVDNQSKSLLAGQYVDLEFTLKNIENAVVVPEAALLNEGGKTYVFKVSALKESDEAARKLASSQDDKELVHVEKREVITGLTQNISNKNWVEIKSGIEELDEIVIRGQGTLFNGGVAEIIR